MVRTISVVALLALGGCSLAPHYPQLKAIADQGIDTAIQDRKDFNDKKAEVILALPCDVSLGAVRRIGDERKRAILIELCGGPKADTQFSVDDVMRLMNALPGQP